LNKHNLSSHRPFGFGNTSRRFTAYSIAQEKGRIAKDRFAFEQSMRGNDCTKIRKNGDFIVQQRDFFGNKIGDPTIFEVKAGNSTLTEAQEKRKRQLGRDRYKIVRY